MQEEVENRTLTLVVSGTKFTGRMFKAAISKYMAHRKEKKLEKQRSRDAPVVPHGKQTVKQLVGQNQGISNIGVAVLIAYSPQNGAILLVIAFLISPMGLPLAAIWLLGKVQDLKYTIQDRVYG